MSWGDASWGDDALQGPAWRRDGREGTVRRVGDQSRDKNTSTKEVVKVSAREQSMERLRAAVLEFAGHQALLDRFHNQEPPIGTVLRWLKVYDGRSGELVIEGVGSADDLQKALRFNVTAPREAVFVAFRAPNGRWYTTAQKGASVFEWDALVKEIGDAPCELASEWTVVPEPEKISEEAMDPTAWARMMFPKKETLVTDVDQPPNG